MQKDMGLECVTPDVDCMRPSGLVHRRHRDRVVLCPALVDSRSEGLVARCAIVHLAARLKARGLDPKIVASPENIAKWQELSADVCESPALQGIDALASYLYESGAVVASDSGSGTSLVPPRSDGDDPPADEPPVRSGVPAGAPASSSVR
jgi:hypothetical protein